MTVKIVPFEHKTYIAHLYAHENAKTDVLAQQYSVSRRTIQRILVEMGVAPVRQQRKVPQYTTQTELPITMTEPTFMEQVKQFFKSIFSTKHSQTNG